jgi:hypothetical protein
VYFIKNVSYSEAMGGTPIDGVTLPICTTAGDSHKKIVILQLWILILDIQLNGKYILLG